jgi:hypothetical protein
LPDDLASGPLALEISFDMSAAKSMVAGLSHSKCRRQFE